MIQLHHNQQHTKYKNINNMHEIEHTDTVISTKKEWHNLQVIKPELSKKSLIVITAMYTSTLKKALHMRM